MIYNFLLFIYFLFSLPKVLTDYIFYKKKKQDILKRLGFKSYDFNSENKAPIIWIHAVSVGESKAAISLLEKLKHHYPSSYIVISSTTQTGHMEAKKSLFLADKFIFFPFDFSFSIKKVFSQIKPNIIIFIETDFWYNFMKIAKKNGSKIVLTSAKISKKSTSNFLKFLKFSKNLFSYFDLILSQNELYTKRFSNFLDLNRVITIGNLKLTNSFSLLTNQMLDKWRSKLNIKNQRVILIASTHHPEEELLVNELKDLKNIKILLAPRHPHRFSSVYHQIKKICPISRLSTLEKKQNTKIVLVDEMGILNILYQISSLCIVAGSFIDRVGGHNILEPVFVSTPVFFGPFMHSQEELKKIVLTSKAGKQLDLKNIKNEISKCLDKKEELEQLSQNCSKLKNNYRNILENTVHKIISLLSC